MKYRVFWTEFGAGGKSIPNQADFGSDADRDQFVDKIMERRSFNAITGYTEVED